LYRTKDRTFVHADLNGAGNIARKAGYEGACLASSGVVTTPMLDLAYGQLAWRHNNLPKPILNVIPIVLNM